KVEVSQAYFESEYGKRLQSAVKRHVRPGFRKGKTPKATVEKELGGALKAQTLEEVVPKVFKAAIIEHRLSPITDPSVENLVFEDDKPLTFDMIVEVRPKITATGFDSLPLNRREVTVADSEVDEVMTRLREGRAVHEAVERAAEDGDRVTIDLCPLGEDDEPDMERKVEGQQLILGEETNFPAFNEGMIGVSAGDEKDITVTYPDDFHNEGLRGNTVTYRCQVQTVEMKTLPDFDDAFAASYQEGQTLLEMRTAIRENLRKEEESRVNRELEEQIVDLLIERNDIDAPPSLVEQYLSSSLEEFHARNAQYGRANSAEQDQQYRDTTKPLAERILKGMFVMEAIRRQENIQVTDEEVDNRIVEVAQENGFDLGKYREFVDNCSERDRIIHGLEERKTFDFLLSRAEFTGKGAAESTAGEPASAAEADSAAD
ncbi:MAG: trigger factor, partial [bacterium]